MRRSIIAALGLALSSCAEARFDPPSQALRDDLGSIVVVAVPAHKATTIDRPATSGEAALYGAGQGALGSITLGLDICKSGALAARAPGLLICAFGLALAVATAPVTALAGAGIGAAVAHPEKEIGDASTNIEAVLHDVRPSEALRDAVANSGRWRVGHALEAREGGASGGTFRDWSSEGFNTVLQVQITQMQLRNEGEIDPDVTVVLDAQADLIRIRDTRLLYSRSWRYQSEEHEFFDVAEDRAQRLRREIMTGVNALGHKIVHDLFIATKPEVRQAQGYPPGVPVTVFTWTPKGS